MRRYVYKICFLFSLFLFFAFTFTGSNPPSNWYQQFLPNLGGQVVNDITFLDSLIGFAVTSKNVNPDSASILKTTNGGDSWNVIFTQTPRRFNKIKFINNATGFVCGGTGSGTPYLYKTTNAGINWFIQSTFGCAYWDDMFVLNEDTLWLIDHDGLCGGVLRTTNGGVNWTQQLNLGGNNPTNIYFYNSSTGYISRYGGSPYVMRTSNSGLNWSTVLSGEGFTDMYFIDNLTGWKGGNELDSIKKTTNGGLNWQKIQLPPTGSFYVFSKITKLSVINEDTIFGVGAVGLVNGNARGLIYKTTNGGINWGYQKIDPAINIFQYFNIKFINKDYGWAYASFSGVHTKVGGDSTLTNVKQLNTKIPQDYILLQNYPNPFNPTTNIKYALKKSGLVTIKVFSITGKEIATLVSQQQVQGLYQTDFTSNNLSSGVYFYTLSVDSKIIDTKKMMLVK